MKTVVALAIVVAVAVLMILTTRVARQRGYKLGPDTVVRCRDGHLFTTVWIPGASFKAIRLGLVRYQRCPVDGRWTFVTPVRDDDLTDADRMIAAQHRDLRIP
jgi:hypothetical protein